MSWTCLKNVLKFSWQNVVNTPFQQFFMFPVLLNQLIYSICLFNIFKFITGRWPPFIFSARNRSLKKPLSCSIMHQRYCSLFQHFWNFYIHQTLGLNSCKYILEFFFVWIVKLIGLFSLRTTVYHRAYSFSSEYGVMCGSSKLLTKGVFKFP